MYFSGTERTKHWDVTRKKKDPSSINALLFTLLEDYISEGSHPRLAVTSEWNLQMED
jgi:hypothetical protein